jgi:hypothetical protein
MSSRRCPRSIFMRSSICEASVKPHARKQIHVVLDNLSTHDTPEVKRWLARNPNVTFHFTTVGSSWINHPTMMAHSHRTVARNDSLCPERSWALRRQTYVSPESNYSIDNIMYWSLVRARSATSMKSPAGPTRSRTLTG